MTTWRETLRVRGGWAVLRASINFFLQGGSYHAAALTYYAILSVFPAGALVYALLGVVGAESAIDSAVDALERRHVESQFVDAFRDTLRTAADQRSDDATIAIVVSTIAAVYVASRWIRGAARGLDAVLDRDRAAGAVRFLNQLRDTMVLVLLFVAALLLAFVGGGLARGLFGDALSTLWQIGAYMIAAGIAACAYAYVYAFVPSPPRFPREALAAGAVLGTIIWGLATAGFLVFADLWPSYDTNYGVFATLIVGIIWLWLTNVSVLLGGAFALEWERGAGAGRARVWQDRS